MTRASPTRRPPLASFLPLLLAAVLPLAACDRSAGPPALTGDHAFLLVHSESNFGQIEPCSCNNRTIGGFPRRATLLDALAKEGPLLVLDAGNSLFSEHIESGPLARQAKVKAKAVARAFVSTGLDAMTFGDLDLLAGGSFFRELVEETKLPVVAANVIDRKSGSPLFPPYVVKELDGVRVAVLGLVATEVHPIVSEMNEEGARRVAPMTSKRIRLEDLFEGGGVKIEDPVETAAALVPRLRQEAHLVVVLSHLPQATVRELGVKVPGIDAVVGSHTPPGNKALATIDDSGTLVLSAPINGIGVGVGRFQVRDGNLMFADATPIERARAVLPTVSEWLADVREQYGTDDPEQLRARDATLADRAERLRAKVADLERLVAEGELRRSTFTHEHVSLDGQAHPDDPEMHAFVREYRRSLADLYTSLPADAPASAAIEKKVGEAWYVGDDACIACHQPQADFWRGTAHAHAWETMIREDATHDLECIGCHTVGFLRPGGFDRPDRVAGYENVQCENCHGPGSMHASGAGFLDPRTIRGGAEEMRCNECHNSEHSPNFKPETYVPRASCPPLDPREPLLRGVYAKVAQDLMPRLGDEQPIPGLFAAIAELKLRLGQADEAHEVASRGLRMFGSARRLRSALARSLDQLGRSEEAIERMNAWFEESDGDRVLLRDLVELLLHARDPAARNAEAALAFAQWALDTGTADASFHAAKAEALRQLGRIDEAVAVLQKLKGSGLTRVPGFNEMLVALEAERAAIQELAAPPPLPAPPGS